MWREWETTMIMFAKMFNSQKSYQKYIENTHLGLLTETHEYYFGSLKHQIFIYSRWRHPPKTISPRPYCRSRRGRNGLGSETKCSPKSGSNRDFFFCPRDQYGDVNMNLWRKHLIYGNISSFVTDRRFLRVQWWLAISKELPVTLLQLNWSSYLPYSLTDHMCNNY